ncbi:MAG: hypothetical protein ACKO4K_09270 [Flavobacteriales bacterium]
MKNQLLWFLLAIHANFFYAQVEWQQKKEKHGWKNDKIPTQCFVDFQRTQSFRTLEPNVAFLNTPLGQRALEKPLTAWSYGAGLLTSVGRFGRLETGIHWIQNGESYDFKSSANDSTFHYESRYRYIGMPLALMVSYGKQFSLFFGPGITPMLFSGYAQKRTWTNAYGAQNDDKINVKNNTYSSAVIQVFGQIGCQYRSKNGWGSYIKGGYRKHITNTYSKYNDYIHRAMGWSIQFGITKEL